MNAQALYDPMNEHDACGVGLVANINNVASHQIVLQGITVLKRLMHRGAAGGDPETGDGAEYGKKKGNNNQVVCG